jgi:predicted O-linked N-acetylglucosamine transferase (SPINDLY family)
MNRPHKVDCTSFDAWVHIVKELAHGAPAVDAQLWLYAPGDEAGASLRTRALARAAKILPGGEEEARDRLVFAGREDRPAHLERLRHADLALDTRAYNSHTLAADYAWAGVPLCTALCDAEPRWV